MQLQALLEQAQDIMLGVKEEVIGQYDLIPDPALTSLSPRLYREYYERYDAVVLSEYAEHCTKLSGYRKACWVAFTALNEQGATLSQLGYCGSLAVASFGVGNEGEFATKVHMEAQRRGVFPIIRILAKDEAEIESANFHSFNILGVSDQQMHALCEKHHHRLLPILNEMTDCAVVDSYLGIAGKVDAVRMQSSAFMTYIQGQNLKVIFRWISDEQLDQAAVDKIDVDVKMICQFVDEKELFKREENLLSYYLQCRAEPFPFTQSELLMELSELDDGIQWQVREGSTYHGFGELARLQALGDLMRTKLDFDPQLERLMANEL